TRYVIEDGNLRLPLLAVDGCGENAAKAIKDIIDKKDFISVEDIQIQGGINKTVMQKLEEMGVFEGLDRTAQMTLF
ncbi:MAG TPA: hypothetical protein DDX91_09320, partial [Ruminococcaceae bacterium]|nr:hypothetical protein [Oscillospiraceae bacterium]